jgi:hypothetical protein
MSGSATGIAVSGSNVYVTGQENSHPGNYQWKSTPCYWINGKLQVLPLTGTEGYAAAIAVSGSNVYIAGWDGNRENTKPCYWLNGVQQALPLTGTKGYAVAIAVSGSDVYIVGSDGDTPGYWLNGTWQALPVAGTQGSAGGIAVSGSDVYIVGSNGDTPGYWLTARGRPFPLPEQRSSPVPSPYPVPMCMSQVRSIPMRGTCSRPRDPVTGSTASSKPSLLPPTVIPVPSPCAKNRRLGIGPDFATGQVYSPTKLARVAVYLSKGP